MSWENNVPKPTKSYPSPSMIPIKVHQSTPFPIKSARRIGECDSGRFQVVQNSQTRVQDKFPDCFAESPVLSDIPKACNIVDDDNITPSQTMTFPRTRIRSSTTVMQELPVNEDDEAVSALRITEWVDTARVSTENLNINATDVETFGQDILETIPIKSTVPAQGERSSTSDTRTGSTTVQIQSSLNVHTPQVELVEPIVHPIQSNDSEMISTSTCTSVQVFFKNDDNQCAESECAVQSVASFQPIGASCLHSYDSMLSPYTKKMDGEPTMSHMDLSPRSSETNKNRVPSFQLVPLLQTPERHGNPSIEYPSPRGSNALSKITPRAKIFNRPRNTSTYEDMFYKKKALIAKGSGTARLFREGTPFSNKFVNYHQFGGNSTHQAVVTKVFTETITEYDEEEDEEEQDGPKQNPANANMLEKTKDRTCIAVKDYVKTPQRVMDISIGESPRKTPRTSFAKEKVMVDANNNSNQTTPIKATTNGEFVGSSNRKLSSKIPRIVLRGHGDPNLQVPTLTSPGCITDSFGSPATEASTPCKTPQCKNCKATKRLLEESEENVRYLQHLLAETQEALCSKSAFLDLHSNHTTNQSSVSVSCHLTDDTTDKSTSVTNLCETQNSASQSESTSFYYSKCFESPSHLNPLVAKQSGNQSKESSSCDIPKFDFNLFFQTYLKHTFSEASSDNHEPFQLSQLLRVSVAARESLCSEMCHKFKHGNELLLQRYDRLVSNELATSSDYKPVLDNYRRFTRYMHNFFDHSLKELRDFDKLYMYNPDDDKNFRYSHEAAMIVNGIPRLGVFIPCNKLVVDSDTQAKKDPKKGPQKRTPAIIDLNRKNN